MLKKLLGGTFFQALPPKIKVLLHALELIIGLYFTTAVLVKATFNDPRLMEYCIQIAIAYLAVYPFLHVVVEMLYGTGPVPGAKSPTKPTASPTKPTA